MTDPGYRAYIEDQVRTASPEQLTLMCYDGALKSMRRARYSLESENVNNFIESINKAQVIINELSASLNLEQGGDLASNMRDVYAYVNRVLSQSVIHRNGSKIDEAENLINEMRDAWVEAMAGNQ